MNKPTFHNAFCDELSIEYPILLAGMGVAGRATPPKLVAAVSEAGGAGIMGCSGLSPEETRRRIHEVRSLTDKPFGVDLLLPAKISASAPTRQGVREQLIKDYPEHVAFVKELITKFDLPEAYPEDDIVVDNEYAKTVIDVILDEKVPIFAAGLGDPKVIVEPGHTQGMKVLGLSGSVRNAIRQCKSGVDAVIAQGSEAGGHTGRVSTFPLIPQVVDEISPTPVIAAGGIADGRGIAASLALGAQAVWIGTAFLVAEECEIYDTNKNQILAGNSQEFEVSRIWTGKTVRVFHNEVSKAWADSNLDPLPTPYQRILMEDFTAAAQKAGRHDLILNPAGQISGMLKKRKPAAKIMQELVEGTIEQLNHLKNNISYY
ncbi:MAG: nitronate monooxygenase [Gammaproteobacteria bacterium]|nr:nitronate monooxygenase [Gammaproteobacteria bacterium]